MNWFEKLDEAISWAMTLALGSVVGGVGWLVRRLFTNQQEIAELKAEFARRDEQRSADREDLREVREDLREVRSDIKRLLER